MPSQHLSPRQFSELLRDYGISISDRQLRRKCADGMLGARYHNGSWQIDAHIALPGFVPAGSITHNRPDGDTGLAPAEQAMLLDQAQESYAAVMAGADVDSMVNMLRQTVGGLLLTLASGHYDRGMAASVRQLGAELRETMKVQAQIRDAESRTIPTEEHTLVVTNLAQAFIETVEAMPALATQQMVADLSSAGIEFEDPGSAQRVIQESLTRSTETARRRLAESMRQSQKQVPNDQEEDDAAEDQTEANAA